jgi:hypothetical protein
MDFFFPLVAGAGSRGVNVEELDLASICGRAAMAGRRSSAAGNSPVRHNIISHCIMRPRKQEASSSGRPHEQCVFKFIML